MKHSSVLQLNRSYALMFQSVFSPVLQRFGVPEQERPYLMDFYMNGLIAILHRWIEHDCEKPIPEVASLMERCVIGSENQKKI